MCANSEVKSELKRTGIGKTKGGRERKEVVLSTGEREGRNKLHRRGVGAGGTIKPSEKVDSGKSGKEWT